MWYAGSGDPGPLGLYSLGYAFSADGTHWTKSANNPELRRGTAGSIRLPFHPGRRPNYWDIGYAIAPLSVSGINDQASGIPRDFELSQNYPNPFNP